MEQLSISASPTLGPIERSPSELLNDLAPHFSLPLKLHLNFNRQSLLSFKSYRHHHELRLHDAFRTAPDEVLKALIAYLKGGPKGAGQIVDTFIHSIEHQARHHKLQSRGRFYDLKEVFDEVNAEYFFNSSQASITWSSRGNKKRRKRSIQLGSYSEIDKLIKIHPCLDQDFVPRQYLAWVIYHEMLHEAYGVERSKNGRRKIHPPEFEALEATYLYYTECQEWEKKNLDRLLRF